MFTLLGSPILDALGILTALTCLIITYFKWSFGYWTRKGVPSLNPEFPHGDLESPFKKTKLSAGIHMLGLYRQAKAQGMRHCGLYFFASPGYMAIDVELVKHILLKDFDHFVDRGFYYNEKTDPLSAHLFAIGGSKWRNLRRKLTPTFSSGKMRSMFKTITDCGKILEKVMTIETKDNEPVDIKDVLGRFTTDIIGTCAFGLECNTFAERDSPFRVYGKKIFSFPTKLEMLMVRYLAFNFPNLGRALGIRQISKDVTDFFSKVVVDTINYRETNNVVRKDFLQLLLEMKSSSDEYMGDGNTLTLNEIAAQCLIFFIAGFETSSTTMTYGLFEMARNPDIQKKVREEVNRVLAKYNGEITYDAINEMIYMGQVIDETLRLYPPVPLITRVCVKDYKLPDEDVVIEKGTKVIIPIMGIHHDSDHYPDPEKFDPERFSPSNKAQMNQFTHMPFGEGKRICIGLRFGIMQSKVGLAVLLKNYEFSINSKTKLPLKFDPKNLILTNADPIWLDSKKIH